MAECIRLYLFYKELWHLLHASRDPGEQAIMRIVLNPIDVVMLCNLRMMAVVGSYDIFVS